MRAPREKPKRVLPCKFGDIRMGAAGSPFLIYIVKLLFAPLGPVSVVVVAGLGVEVRPGSPCVDETNRDVGAFCPSNERREKWFPLGNVHRMSNTRTRYI